MIRKLSIKPALDDESLYPASDGRPLGETDYHVDSTLSLYGALKRALASHRNLHIACNMFLYYEPRRPQRSRRDGDEGRRKEDAAHVQDVGRGRACPV